jgi:hypothetical protein
VFLRISNAFLRVFLKVVSVWVVAVPRDSILEKFIEPIGGAQIRIPSNLNLTINDSEKVFVRVSCLRYSAV